MQKNCFTPEVHKNESGLSYLGYELCYYYPSAGVIYAVNGPGIGVIEGFTLDAVTGTILETWGPDTHVSMAYTRKYTNPNSQRNTK